MSKKLVISLALAVAFLFATNVRAEYVIFHWYTAGEFVDGIIQNGERAGYLSLSAIENYDGTGVDFRFESTRGSGLLENIYVIAGGWKGVFDDKIHTRFETEAGEFMTVRGMTGSSAPNSYLFSLFYEDDVTWDYFTAAASGGDMRFFLTYRDGSFLRPFFADYVTSEKGAMVVPEPATLAVLGLGLAGLGFARARRKKIA